MRHLVPFLLLVPLATAAQSWAPIGAKWTYEQGHVGGPDTNLAIIHAVDDSLLAGRTYTRFEVSEGFFGCHSFIPLFAANNDTVWYWDTTSEQEQLMFRWNAVPGDMWSTPISFPDDVMDTLQWTVVDTGHVLIDGMVLRQLSMNVGSGQGFADSPNQGLFTERLGGHTAPFTWHYGPCDAEIFNRLRCYQDPDIQWRNPSLPTCALGPLTNAAQSWAPIGAQWTYKIASAFSPDTSLLVMEAASDTLIHGQTYVRLSSTTGGPGCTMAPLLHRTSNDSLLFWDEHAQRAQLLFRWDAIPGDTWRTPISDPWSGGELADTLLWTVMDTSMVLVDGRSLWRFDVSCIAQHGLWYPANGGSITERLGPAFSPFGWAYIACDGDMPAGLRCYQDPDIQWQDPSIPTCALGLPPTVRFDDPDATWYVADTHPNASQQDPGFIETSTSRYFFNGDSTVAGEPWRRMWSQPTVAAPPPPAFEGLVRQSGALVFFMDPAGTLDTLYDFGVQVGDTVNYTMPGLGDFPLTVVSIDSLPIQGAYHKVIQFDTSDVFITPESRISDRWIEGIGSIHGPLATRFAHDLEDWPASDSTRTTCYTQGGPVLWLHPGYTDCAINIIQAVDEFEPQRVNTYPNPADEFLFVEGLPPGTWIYRILDALGRTIIQGAIPAHGPRAIDVRTLPKGLHILQVATPRPTAFRFSKQ